MRWPARVLVSVLAACGAPRALAEPPPLALAPGAVALDPPWLPPAPGDLVTHARALRARGDAAAARARLETALVIAPAYDGARVELADLLLADGADLDYAAEVLAGVRAPHAPSEVLAGRLAELRGDDAGAADAYARALLEADDPELRLRRGLALDRLGRPTEAVAELERVRAARPHDTLARASLAKLYDRGGRLRQAEAEYRAIAQAHPDRAQAWEDLARACERAGHPADARRAHERARKARGAPTRELRPLQPSRR
jgi:tetratricopeptide (TPR) repeat protein